MEIEEEIKLRREFQNTQDHTFFIKYFADEGECFPMEIKPEHININDYDINFD